MNGKAAKRIWRAAAATYSDLNSRAGEGAVQLNRVYRTLKREYKAKPYYLRDLKFYGGYVSHKKRIARRKKYG